MLELITLVFTEGKDLQNRIERYEDSKITVDSPSGPIRNSDVEFLKITVALFPLGWITVSPSLKFSILPNFPTGARTGTEPSRSIEFST